MFKVQSQGPYIALQLFRGVIWPVSRAKVAEIAR